MTKPIVMVLGVTGTLGRLVAQELKTSPEVQLRVTARKTDQVKQLRSEYGDAVFLDLDDDLTFDTALDGVDRLFLLTGYSVDMLAQAKSLVDAAVKAGVKHIVQLGVFTPERECSDPHFAWHQLIQSYIRESGINWTFLHPNVFMEGLVEKFSVRPGEIRWWTKENRIGWIALKDVAESAAKILSQGEQTHHGKDYWFSTEVLSIQEIAKTLSSVSGLKINAPVLDAENFRKTIALVGLTDPYFTKGAYTFYKQINAGRMQYLAEVRDDVKILLNRPGTTLKEWAVAHRQELIEKHTWTPQALVKSTFLTFLLKINGLK